MTNAASASAPNLRIRCQRRHPPAAILGRSGTMVKARTLHLSGLNRTAFPASYPQHGFVVQSVRMPRFWGDAGSNPVEARWAQWPHAKRWVPEREIVCDRWHEPVAGQEFLCSHGPSTVPHAGTVFAVVAQLAEQRPRNAQVTGPNPVDGSFSTKTDLFFSSFVWLVFREACNRTGVEDSGNAAVAQLAEQPPCKRQVVGS